MVEKPNHIALKIALRLVLINMIFLFSAMIYERYMWYDDLDKEAPMVLDLLSMQDSVNVVYLGESSNFSYNPEKDSLTDRISDFVSAWYPGIPFGTLNHSAHHAGIFKPIIRRIKPSGSIETIILTLNMRTLGQAVTHSELETALRKMAVMYEPRPPLLNRVLMTLNHYDDQSYVERDREMWRDWTYDSLFSEDVEFPYPTIKTWCETVKFPLPDGSEDMGKRQLADHYIKAYAFIIDENNPRIRDLDEIVHICRDKNLNLVFNLLAENVEYADSLVGDNLVWLMKRNRDYLVNRYAQMGVVVVDNLTTVPGWDYTDQHWTTEHYGEYGRQLVARNVADSLRKWYPGEYVAQPILRARRITPD